MDSQVVSTLEKCGTYLLSEDDRVIGYNIFEEFDTGVISFLHVDALQSLHDAGLINEEIVYKSSTLRNLVLELQQSDDWNISAVRSSPDWKRVLVLTDEIKVNLKVYQKQRSTTE